MKSKTNVSIGEYIPIHNILYHNNDIIGNHENINDDTDIMYTHHDDAE